MVLHIFSLYVYIHMYVCTCISIYTYTFAHRMHHPSKLKLYKTMCLWVHRTLIVCDLACIVLKPFQTIVKTEKYEKVPKSDTFQRKVHFHNFQLSGKVTSPSLGFTTSHIAKTWLSTTTSPRIPTSSCLKASPAMAKIPSVTGVVSPPISGVLAPILVTGNWALFVPQVFLNSLYWR